MRAAPFTAGSALTIALAASVSACGTPQQPQAHAVLTPYLQGLVRLARKEGELDLTFADSDTTDEMNAWTSGFNTYYGLTLKVVPLANPLMPQNANTVVQEVQARQPASTDVYFGVSVFIQLLEQQHAVIQGALRNLPNVAGLAEDGDTTVSLATLPSGITYNRDRVRGSEVPHSLEDVLSEPPTVLIASSPYAGTLAALPRRWGVDRAITYAVKLSAKLKGLFGCGEESRLVTGEFDMFVTDCGDSAARRLSQEGAPLAEVFPSDGSVLNQWYLVIPINARHPAAARLWINYLLSRQAQDILWRYEAVDNARVAGSHTAALIASDEAHGARFATADMAAARLDAPYAGAGSCIQAIINNQESDPSCAPYRATIQAAGTP